MSMREMSWVMNFKDNASQGIQDVQQKFKQLNGELKDASNNKVSETFKNLGDRTSKVGKTMGDMAKKTRGASLAAGGVVAAGAKSAMDFGEKLSFAATQANMSKGEMDELGESIKKLDKYSSSVDLMDAAGMFASAGMSQKEIIGAMGATDQLAQLTGDTEVAGDVMLTSKVAFDLDLSNVEDVQNMGDKFAKGQALAKVSVDELNEAVKTGQGTFKAMNMSADDTLASTVLLAQAGYTGSQAGTMMNSTFNDLVGKAENGRVALGDFSLGLYDAEGQMKSMPELMREIEEGTANMSEEQRNAALNSVFGANSQKMVNAFLGQGADAYDEYAEAIKGADGDLKNMSEGVNDNFAGQMKKLKSQLGDSFIELGENLLPVFKIVTDGITKIIDKFNGLSPFAKKAISFGTLFIAALSPVFSILSGVFGVVGKVFGIFAKVAVLVKKIIGIVKIVGAVIAANPIILVIAAIVAAVVLLVKHWDKVKEKAIELKEKMSEVFGSIGEKWNELKGKLTEAITGRIDAVKEGFQNGVAGVKEKWGDIKSTLGNIARGYVEAKKERFESAIQTVRNIWSGIKSFMAAPLSGKVQALTAGFGKAIDAVKNKWKEVKALLKSPISGTINLFQNLRNKGKAAKDGSHKTGLDNVPFDGYMAELHKDEMVLTRGAAEQFRSMGGTKNGIGNNALQKINTTSSSVTSNNNSNSVNIPEINVSVHTSGEENPNAVGNEVGVQITKQIDKYFKEMGLIW